LDPQALEKVSARLGEAVLDPAQWPDLMEEICRAVGAEGAALLQGDVRTPDVPVTPPVKEFFATYFREGWNERDLRATRTVPLLLAGRRVVVDEDVGPPEEMRTHPFYNDFIYGFGLRWWTGIGFQAGPAIWGMCLQLTARQGPHGRQDMRHLSRLAPLLTEVATLSTAVGRVALASATNALDLMRQPAIAIDHFGFVLDANVSAQSILDGDIRIKAHRLVVADGEAQRCLDNLVLRLTTTPDTSALGGLQPIIVRREARAPLMLGTLPVPTAARSPFFGARAILTLTPLEPKPRPAAPLLAHAFDLSAAEAKLASVLATGASLEAAADELCISRETARTQLKAIFAKTDTHRQGQLVALLARI
jgi:DNA-binding CsgD family transcriptional regulator